MPLERCGSGNSGWKVHNTNKCFTGPGARERALKMLQAIEISKHNRAKSEQIIKDLESEQILATAAQQAQELGFLDNNESPQPK